MASSLREIPTANRGRPRRGEPRRPPRPILPVGAGPRPRRRGAFVLPRPRLDLLLPLVLAVVLIALLFNAWRDTWVQSRLVGLDDGAVVPAARLAGAALAIDVTPSNQLDHAVFTVNGAAPPSREVRVEPGRLSWSPPADLADGDYRLRLEVPRPPFRAAVREWRITLDSRPPSIELGPVSPAALDAAVTIEGVAEPGASLSVDGAPAALDADGRFRLAYTGPPRGGVRLEALDRAGNRSERRVVVPVAYPATQGIHVTAAAWNHAGLKASVLDLVRAGKINAVQLDLKDEAGVVGFASRNPLAAEIGAVQDPYDLAAAVSELHGLGVRVIGRVVAFRDPILARDAWAKGRRDWVVQTPDGSPYAVGSGLFTNYVVDEVRRYNLDLAGEAAALGVDEILWDYVRRPEGSPSAMHVPGLTTVTSEWIGRFLADGHDLLRPLGVYQGASVFGIAASRGDAVGQDVALIARHTDYVAPMVYPSHWGKGEYGVADPNRQPGEIVKASLKDFQAVAGPAGTPLNPWLQDFSLGVAYGPKEVRAQIDAARSLGIDSFLLWSPTVRYNDAALDPLPR
ncbi:MAG: putative glycoside hydrolase [Acidimicrobiales bacterium]